MYNGHLLRSLDDGDAESPPPDHQEMNRSWCFFPGARIYTKPEITNMAKTPFRAFGSPFPCFSPPLCLSPPMQQQPSEGFSFNELPTTYTRSSLNTRHPALLLSTLPFSSTHQCQQTRSGPSLLPAVPPPSKEKDIIWVDGS